MPIEKAAAAIIEDWRAVQLSIERVTASAARLPTGSAELPELMAEMRALEREARRLRDEYQGLTIEAIRTHRPEPPPFPST